MLLFLSSSTLDGSIYLSLAHDCRMRYVRVRLTFGRCRTLDDSHVMCIVHCFGFCGLYIEYISSARHFVFKIYDMRAHTQHVMVMTQCVNVCVRSMYAIVLDSFCVYTQRQLHLRIKTKQTRSGVRAYVRACGFINAR